MILAYIDSSRVVYYDVLNLLVGLSIMAVICTSCSNNLNVCGTYHNLILLGNMFMLLYLKSCSDLNHNSSKNDMSRCLGCFLCPPSYTIIQYTQAYYNSVNLCLCLCQYPASQQSFKLAFYCSYTGTCIFINPSFFMCCILDVFV